MVNKTKKKNTSIPMCRVWISQWIIVCIYNICLHAIRYRTIRQGASFNLYNIVQGYSPQFLLSFFFVFKSYAVFYCLRLCFISFACACMTFDQKSFDIILIYHLIGKQYVSIIWATLCHSTFVSIFPWTMFWIAYAKQKICLEIFNFIQMIFISIWNFEMLLSSLTLIQFKRWR